MADIFVSYTRTDQAVVQRSVMLLQEPVIHGVAFDRWFKPGNGKIEWFKDIDIGPEMVVVPAGKFVMGSNDRFEERPPHKVRISKPFAVVRFAVTFDEWDAAGLPHKADDRRWGRGGTPHFGLPSSLLAKRISNDG